MNNVPGIITAVGGLRPSFLIIGIGAFFLFWGINRMKWNNLKVDERKFLTRFGGTVMGVGILWLAAITFLPYFMGVPK